MNIQQLLNENIRAGGKSAEEAFVRLTNNKVQLVNTKTKITYYFKFGDNNEKKITQGRVLSRLIKEGIDSDINSISVRIEPTESNLYKWDAVALEEIKNKKLWTGVNEIKKDDKIEIKKEGYYCKAFYAETFKLSSRATMDRYKKAEEKIKDNYDAIVNDIINKIKLYIENNLQEVIDSKDTSYFPHKLATLSGKEWIVSGWTKEEFWKDMKVQNVGYGSDDSGRPIPRIQLHFNESLNIESNLLEFKKEITNGSNALQIEPEDKLTPKKNVDNKIIPFKAEFKIEIPFTIYFKRG